MANWVSRNRQAAHAETTRAIRVGELVRQPCSVCGVPKADAHHADYNHPLEITWLCRSHHVGWHAKNGPGIKSLADHEPEPIPQVEESLEGGIGALLDEYQHPLERARRQLRVSFEALSVGGGVSSRVTRYHCQGIAAPSIVTAIGYSYYLWACNRAAGCPLAPERLSVEALFHPKKERCPSSKPKASCVVSETNSRSCGSGRSIPSLVTPASPRKEEARR